MASIFAQLGFDGLLLGRIDYQDKAFRFSTKSAEMVWEASDNLGEKILTTHSAAVKYKYSTEVL